MAKRERVEVVRMKGFIDVQSSVAANVVFALQRCRRAVEVEWDGADRSLVFYAYAPLPKSVPVPSSERGKE